MVRDIGRTTYNKYFQKWVKLPSEAYNLPSPAPSPVLGRAQLSIIDIGGGGGSRGNYLKNMPATAAVLGLALAGLSLSLQTVSLSFMSVEPGQPSSHASGCPGLAGPCNFKKCEEFDWFDSVSTELWQRMRDGGQGSSLCRPKCWVYIIYNSMKNYQTIDQVKISLESNYCRFCTDLTLDSPTVAILIIAVTWLWPVVCIKTDWILNPNQFQTFFTSFLL